MNNFGQRIFTPFRKMDAFSYQYIYFDIERRVGKLNGQRISNVISLPEFI